MPEAPPPDPDSARACLARLYEMDAALEQMEVELPDDVRPLGAEARRRVHSWLTRLGGGDADLRGLTDAMRDISRMMDALTARLLLVPWDGHPPAGKQKS
ncbi:MAG: hypothetical protein E6J64_06800 [Deltaproteobacteria bacterium]|nr:MAG: hypothetical protein E6J64_06800 [Deltaproteobacteria bacterium]